MKAIAVDFNDLWKIRAPVGHCEGFDLHTFDKLIEVGGSTWFLYFQNYSHMVMAI